MTGQQTPDAQEQALRGVGLRVTQPRLEVLRAVGQRPHADTGTLLAGVRERLGSVSHQAVYDCLDALTRAGLLRRIQPAGSAARYELRVGDNHHHLVCRACGAVADVDCAVGHAPCLQVENDQGYVIDEAEVVFWGLCPSCASEAVAASEKSPSTTERTS